MIRVIMGKKGSGKTKQMIDMINNAVQTEHGNVVCIERGSKLTYDIHYQIRLVEASHYDIKSYDFLTSPISSSTACARSFPAPATTRPRSSWIG